MLRTLVTACGLFCMLQISTVKPALLIPSIGFVTATACLVLIAARNRRSPESRLGLWMIWFGVACGLVMAVGQSIVIAPGNPFVLTLSVILGVSAVVAVVGSGRRASAAFLVTMIAYAGLGLIDLSMVHTRIDVRPLLEGGLDATLSGRSPYGITVANPFTAAESIQYLAPGAVVDGRIIFGYPYLPVPLLLDIPAHVLGDARWMHLFAMVGAAAIAWRLSTDRIGRAASVLLIINPLTTAVLIAYWVEPVMVLLLALTASAMLRGDRVTGVFLGLFFASKQYAVSYVPVLWSVARSAGWRAVWTAAIVGGLIVGAFAMWDPSAFIHSAIEFHLVQPFRDDSMSLLPGLADVFGTMPGWLLTLSPVVGLLVSLLLAVRTKPGATALLLGVGLSLMFTVLLSKQAHMNYYLLIGAALLLAVVIWPRDNPIPEPEAASRDLRATDREPSPEGSRAVG